MAINNKKVIVTGGAGFIGSNLVEELIRLGHEVHVVDNLTAGLKENVHKDAVLHVVDVRDTKKLKEIFKGTSIVFHLAALPRVQLSIENPIETHDVNVNGTLSVIEAARHTGVGRIVFAASSSAYGDQEDMPLKEDMLVQPKSPYALHKHIGELYMKMASEFFNIETVSLRFFNVYGPRQNEEGAYALVIAKFLKQKREKIPLTITGDGEQTRDFTHVRDTVRAVILAGQSKNVGKGEVINIGVGKNISVNKIANIIGGEVVHIPVRFEPRHSLADNKKAKKLLGWEPSVSIEEGIKEFLG